MKKTFFYIFVIILILGAVFVGVYFALNKKSENLPSKIKMDQPKTQFKFPQEQDQQTKDISSILINEPIIDYQIFTDPDTGKTFIFYFSKEGKLYKLTDQEKELLSDRLIENPLSLKLSADGSLILVSYLKNRQPIFEIFDLNKKTFEVLDGIVSASFSPEGKKLAYLKKDKNSEKTSIFIKDFSKKRKNVKKISSLYLSDFKIVWLDNKNLILVPKPTAYLNQKIFKINIARKTFSLFSEGKGLSIKLSPDRSSFVVFEIKRFNNQKPEPTLTFNSLVNNLSAQLSFVSLPEKCLSMPQKIICAIPRNQKFFKKQTLPDDYLKKNFYSLDDIYEINIKENSSLPLLLDKKIDAINLQLTENNLFFINRLDKKLYQVKF